MVWISTIVLFLDKALTAYGQPISDVGKLPLGPRPPVPRQLQRPVSPGIGWDYTRKKYVV